jgi:hypothetical protein
MRVQIETHTRAAVRHGCGAVAAETVPRDVIELLVATAFATYELVAAGDARAPMVKSHCYAVVAHMTSTGARPTEIADVPQADWFQARAFSTHAFARSSGERPRVITAASKELCRLISSAQPDKRAACAVAIARVHERFRTGKLLFEEPVRVGGRGRHKAGV